MKKIKIMVLALAFGLLLSGCAKKTDSKVSNQIDEDGVLTVGFDQNFPPMGFVGDDGEFTGFDLDLAKATADKLGLEIKYQPIAWDAKDLELESKNIDCIWNGFTMTGREDNYLFSIPYMENSQIFVINKDSGIKSKEDLKDKTLVVQVDSSAEKLIKENKTILDNLKQLQTTADYNTAFMELESGSCDAIAMDIVVASYQLEKRKDDKFVILDDKIASEKYGVGFAKDNEKLKTALDKALIELANEGTLEKISNKWFGKDITIVK